MVGHRHRLEAVLGAVVRAPLAGQLQVRRLGRQPEDVEQQLYLGVVQPVDG
jgi:hypothetical protein